MRTLSYREKNLGVFTVFFCCIVGLYGFRSHFERTRIRLAAEVEVRQQKVDRAKALVAAAEAARPAVKPVIAAIPSVNRKVTLYLLDDIADSREGQHVRIVSAEKSGDASYRIIVQGEFEEMMQFLSFLERQDGKFVVSGAQLHRLSDAGESGAPNRNIQATVQLSMRS